MNTQPERRRATDDSDRADLLILLVGVVVVAVLLGALAVAFHTLGALPPPCGP